MSENLPEYEEEVIELKMNDQQAKVYGYFEDDMKHALKDALAVGDNSFLGSYLNALLSYLEADDWRRKFEVNVIGAAMTAKQALLELRKTKGRLALVDSGASLATVPMYGAYCASKYALRAIGQTLAIELYGSGVSCTVLYPGYMDTEFIQIDNSGHFNPNKKKVVNRFMWSAEKSAKASVRAIHKRKFAFTPMGKIFCWFGAHTPGLFHFLTTRFGTPGVETLDAA